MAPSVVALDCRGQQGAELGVKNILVCRVSTSSDHANSWKGRELQWSAFLQRTLSLQVLRLQRCCKNTTIIRVLWC